MRQRLTYTGLFIACLFGAPNLVLAQEEDPYADYSYLWEDTKKKKKKKNDKTTTVNEETTGLPDSKANETITQQASPEIIPQQSELADEVDEETEDEVDETEDIEPKEKKKAASGTDFRAGLPGLEPKTTINASLGYTYIDGQHFVGLNLAPEFAFGKLGVGLHVPILYGLEDQSIRTEIFENGVGPARLIRYVRYGAQKQDPYYFRLGELDNIMLGFGSLMNNYTNTTSYEKRKLGLHFDVNYRGLGGIEGVYSDFDPRSLNLFAIRPYARPLATSGIPVASTFEIGGSYITDKDQTKIPTSDSTSTAYVFTEPGISAFWY